MRVDFVIAAAMLAGVALPAFAQEPPAPPRPPRIERSFGVEPRELRAFSLFAARPGAAIGVTTSSASSSRDTMGVLVSSVLPGSPAEKAGIQEGDRIASVNGVSLRLASSDVGDAEMSGIMSRRLTRVLDHVKPGDQLDLRVSSNGQLKSMRVKAANADSLYRAAERRRVEDRPTLGIGIASTGNARDSLGVFVMSVEPGGPAEKAGIEEGNRIAAINGVDLRSQRAAERGDDDEMSLNGSRLGRLQREVEKLHPGDEATLRVYSGGRYRDVKVKLARAGELPRARRSMIIIRGDGPRMNMDFESLRMDMPRIGEEVGRAMGEAGVATGRAIDGMRFNFAPVFGQARVVW